MAECLFTITGDLKDRFLAMEFLRKLYQSTKYEYYRKKNNTIKAEKSVAIKKSSFCLIIK